MRISFEYDTEDITQIITIPEGGLDFRFKAFTIREHNGWVQTRTDDLSVETAQWNTIQEFLDWYAQQKIAEEPQKGV